MAQMTRGKICVSLAGVDIAALVAQACQVAERFFSNSLCRTSVPMKL